MIAVGLDVGSTTTKAVVLEDERTVRAAYLCPSGDLPADTARRVVDEVLGRAEMTSSDVDVVATTGYGRRLADIGDVVMTEIKACAAGILFGQPEGEPIHTVIDVGGQDTKVIALGDAGQIEDFSMNDKCAAGTGRFLEVLSAKLGLDYEAFVEAACGAQTTIQMNATCAVFAESEVVGLLARGVAKADIAAAAHDAMANRIASMVRRVGVRGRYAFVGGGARNRAMVEALGEHLNQALYVPEDAQLVVALGAAVGGARKARARRRGPGATEKEQA